MTTLNRNHDGDNEVGYEFFFERTVYSCQLTASYCMLIAESCKLQYALDTLRIFPSAFVITYNSFVKRS
jgi:hypothetical protein